MLRFLADVGVQDVKQGYGSLIFTGCLFLAVIIALIWWLKRSA